MNDPDKVIPSLFADKEPTDYDKLAKCGYIMFSCGLNSNYYGQVFAILKPFKLADVAAEFRGQWKQSSKPDPCDFFCWLSRSGYIRDATEVLDIYLGDDEFGTDGLDPGLMKHTLEPAES